MTKEDMSLVHLRAHNDGRVGLCDEAWQYLLIHANGTLTSSRGWSIGSIARSIVTNRMGTWEKLRIDKRGQPKL